MKRRKASLTITVLPVLFFSIYALWVVPQWQVAHLQMDTSAKEVAVLENEYRKTLAQIVGGAFFIIGVYLGWRRVAAAEKTVAVSQEEQITERFTRAVDQLGSVNPEIRLGGIYSLARIAKESEKDHWPVVEILTGYIRTRAPRTEGGRNDEESFPEAAGLKASQSTLKNSPPVDIQAALTVLGQRSDIYLRGEPRCLDLSGTNLSN